MKITVKVDVYCASGFYCKRSGKKLCSKLKEDGRQPYCEIFLPLLQTDSKGNVLKCEDCLLAERKERIK